VVGGSSLDSDSGEEFGDGLKFDVVVIAGRIDPLG
jgi:hypothetical protein